MTREQAAITILAIAEAYLEAIQSATKESALGGMPNGELYALAMSHGFPLELHIKVVRILKESGKVVERNHLLMAVPPPAFPNGRWN